MNKHKKITQKELLHGNIMHKKMKPLLFLALILLIVAGLVMFMISKHNANLTKENAELLLENATFAGQESVFIYEDKTFVAHEEDPIDVTIYTSSSCATCAQEVEDITRKIRNAVPTLQNVIVRDVDEEDVQEEALAADVAYVPSASFSSEIDQTDFFSQAPEFFHERSNGSYQFFVHTLGHAPAKYIASPKGMKAFSEPEATPTTATPVKTTVPAKDPLEIHAFLTPDCPSCKTAHDTLDVISQQYPGVKIVRHYSEAREEKPYGATKAIACATASGKGSAYAANLFLRQAAWKVVALADLSAVFKRYAGIYGITATDFDSCIAKDNAELAGQDMLFETFGISSVPTIFVGDQVFTGVQTIPTLTKAIQTELAPPVAATSTQVNTTTTVNQ